MNCKRCFKIDCKVKTNVKEQFNKILNKVISSVSRSLQISNEKFAIIKLSDIFFQNYSDLYLFQCSRHKKKINT